MTMRIILIKIVKFKNKTILQNTNLIFGIEILILVGNQ